ncbi:MAG TPA: GNAT family N-acetyltransferase [Mycobacterium sp.]
MRAELVGSCRWWERLAGVYSHLMSGDGEVIVREALDSDAGGVARTHVDSWRETYSGVLDERFFSMDAFRRRLEFWTCYLSTEPRPGRMAVAVRDGDVIGFANAGDAVGPDAEHGVGPARPLHLFSIYLLLSAHGTGAGQALLDSVVSDEPAQLWVLRGNDRAISFYQRNGFAFDGVEYIDPARVNLVELRMVR